MRKIHFAPWALAAVMAVASPGAHSAWAVTSPSSTKLLTEHLPTGIALRYATVDQTAKALSAAASEHPEMVMNLTQAAVMSKTPKPGEGQLKCSTLTKLISAAMQAVPQKSSDIMQMALSMHPECADALNTLVASPINNGTDGFNTPQDLYGGFGVGFGPGFPGSPGFVGSPPSGAIALPPTAVTNTLNI